MIRLADLTYYTHQDYCTSRQVINRHRPANAFATYLKGRLDIRFIKHAGFEGREYIDGIPYHFFRSSNRFWYIPLKTHRFIRLLNPDIILVQGLIFPLQVMHLRWLCNKRCKIVLQHHGELPCKGIRGFLQKIACRLAGGFIFTAAGNADCWQQQGIIPYKSSIFELAEASSWFKRQDKQISRKQLGMLEEPCFLWVGHLSQNKDPLTVLCAFEQYSFQNPRAKLYMIYQATFLLEQVKRRIAESEQLSRAVILAGSIPHSQLPRWYSAADYYLSGSHKEGSGYALLEAMACGCIPVVTDIPSYVKITGNGKCGFLYPPGKPDVLAGVLLALKSKNPEQLSAEVLEHFSQNLTFTNISDNLLSICNHLMENKAAISAATADTG